MVPNNQSELRFWFTRGVRSVVLALTAVAGLWWLGSSVFSQAALAGDHIQPYRFDLSDCRIERQETEFENKTIKSQYYVCQNTSHGGPRELIVNNVCIPFNFGEDNYDGVEPSLDNGTFRQKVYLTHIGFTNTGRSSS